MLRNEQRKSRKTILRKQHRGLVPNIRSLEAVPNFTTAGGPQGPGREPGNW